MSAIFTGYSFGFNCSDGLPFFKKRRNLSHRDEPVKAGTLKITPLKYFRICDEFNIPTLST